MSVATSAKTTTFRSAVSQIRSKIRDASRNVVHVYSFNVLEDQLESAHKLLDKEQERRSMRVTYSPDHNFIVRYMPGRVHERSARYWDNALTCDLNKLILSPPQGEPPGCEPTGSITFDIGPVKKQPDGGVCPTGFDYPSVVLEVGSFESLSQLRIDAQLWLECTNYVNLVVLICIDPPLPPNTTPQITFQLWRPRPNSDARQRVAAVVQNDDWILNATTVRIPLFGAQIPADYGVHTYVDIDTQRLRQKIINSSDCGTVSLLTFTNGLAGTPIVNTLEDAYRGGVLVFAPRGRVNEYNHWRRGLSFDALKNTFPSTPKVILVELSDRYRMNPLVNR